MAPHTMASCVVRRMKGSTRVLQISPVMPDSASLVVRTAVKHISEQLSIEEQTLVII